MSSSNPEDGSQNNNKSRPSTFDAVEVTKGKIQDGQLNPWFRATAGPIDYSKPSPSPEFKVEKAPVDKDIVQAANEQGIKSTL